ncbi:MAG: molybdopterin synthase catalytic subunit MoaE [Pseudomonadota bacterium]
MPRISVQEADFDVSRELQRLCDGRTDIGATVSFVGLVRDMNLDDSVVAMGLQHYPGMTEKALQKIVVEAAQRWEVLDATVIHRVGELTPAEQIVLVCIASTHRHDAFEACSFIMDYLKTRAPFWKKEVLADGSSRWVDARDSDDNAADRWKE